MRKIKMVIASFLGVIAVALSFALGARVNAATVTEECSFNNAISNTFYGNNGNSYKPKSYSGTSILPSKDTTVSYTHCIQKGCSFTVENSWTGKIFFKNINSGEKTININLNNSSGSTNVYNKAMSSGATDTADISGAAGTFTIDGGSNCGLYEIYITYEELAPTTKTFTLSYNSNGGSGTMTSDSNEEALSAETSTFTLKSNTFTRIGYSFAGWDTNSAATEPTYAAGASFTATNVSTTIYAIWEVDKSDIEYNLTFDANGGTSGDTTSLSQTVAYDTESYDFTIPAAATPTREDYEFLGWATTNNATEAAYEVGDAFTATNLNSTLYAVWGKTITKITSNYLYYLTENSLPDDSHFEISSAKTSNSKGNATFNNITSSYCIKMESSTSISFNLNESMKVTFVFGSTETASMKIDGTNITGATSNEYSVILSSGVHTITKNGTVNLFFIYFATLMNKNTTASVFAEKNTTLNTLRFVGTITGITDLADIESIELVLLKDDKPTNNQIFFNKVFTAVTGTSQTCSGGSGIYYVVFRITNASALGGSTISKQLIVTFTDGSQTVCDATTFDLVWED